MDKKRYSGVIVKCKDKVLLCKRNNLGSFPGMWSLPGGKVEPNEETKDAAKREFFEETAVDIDGKDIKFVGLIPRHTRDGKKVKGLMYVYLLEVDEEIHPNFELAIDGEEHTEYGYFNDQEVTEGQTGEYLHKMLEVILNKH